MQSESTPAGTRRNNENLGRLSCKITSPLVFAHVRAAYPGMPVSEQNCHPFQVCCCCIVGCNYPVETIDQSCMHPEVDVLQPWHDA